MAIEYDRTDVASGYNLSKINQNFVNIETALQDGLSRTGNGPNQMQADLDMNSNDILNANIVDATTIVVDGVDIGELTSGLSEAIQEAQDAAAAALVASNQASQAAQDAADAAELALELAESLDVNSLVAKTTTLNNGAGISPIGDLSTNRTIALTPAAQASLLLADGSAQKSSNLSDLTNISTARANLGLVLASDAEAIAASTSTTTLPAVNRIRSMIEAWGTIQSHWFGIRPNINSDTQASVNGLGIQDALTAIDTTRNGGLLEMPEGDIWLGYTAFRSLSGDKTIGIKGKGSSTKFICDGDRGNQGVVHLSTGGNGHTYVFEDFDVIFKGAVTGDIISATCPYFGAVQGTNARVKNIAVKPYVTGSGYITGSSLNLAGNWHARISSFWSTSAYGPGVWEDFSNTSLKYRQDSVINLNECYAPCLDHIYLWGGYRGIKSESFYNFPTGAAPVQNVATQPEGFWMSNYQIVNCRDAFRWYRGRPAGPNREPQLNLLSGHINYRDTGIYIEGAFQFDVSKHLIYNSEVSPGSSCIDIYLKNAVAGILGDNQHMDTANTGKRTGVVVDGTVAGELCQQIAIRHAQFGERQMYDAGQRIQNGVWVRGAQSTDITIYQPKYPAGVFVGGVLFNDGAGAGVSVVA